MWGSARPRQADARSADGFADGDAPADAREPHVGGDIVHVDFGERDPLDTFAQVWRSRARHDPYDVTAFGDDPPEGDALEHPGDAPSIELIRKRARLRRQLREFLRAVPRRESEVMLVFEHCDGTTHRLTRGQLTAAIERMRPRMRQIVHLAVEERWPRQRVCEYLGHISLKTVERDQREAFDLLAEV
jgi:hypothetical protein